MSNLLEGKAIVIIGGTTGLGLSAARTFVSRGAKVVVTGISSVDEAAAAIGPGGIVIESDAREEGSAEEAIRRSLSKFGGFNGLYHVAGGSGRRYGDGPLHELTMEGWNTTLELNLTSMMRSNRAAVRQFRLHGQGGAILNMGSVLASSPSSPYFTTHAYAASKAAIEGFSKSIAAHYAADNIRINVIAPGLVETPMSLRATGDERIMSFIRTKQPLDGGRIGRTSDLDGLAALLLSDEGAFITGQIISVDGGWSVSEGQQSS
ncbi:MAG: SDR family NAD(P)-dependent oxidoreductase [Bacteroidota bacterium]